MAATQKEISKSQHGLKNVQLLLLHVDCDPQSSVLLLHLPDNNRILEENNVPGYDETIQLSSYYKVTSISKVLNSIALLQLLNSCERNTGTTKEISKQGEKSKNEQSSLWNGHIESKEKGGINARGLRTKLIKEIKKAIKGLRDLELNGGRQEKGHIGEIELENVMKLDVGGKRKNRESGKGEKREVRQFIHVTGGRKMQRIRRPSGPHRVKRQGGLGIDKEGGESREEREKRVKKRKLIGRMFSYMILLALPSGIKASVVIAPSRDYTAFENNTLIFTINCSGNGKSLLWTVDGYSSSSSYVLNKGIQYTPFISSPDGLTVSSQLIVPTTKANNNITVICTVQDSLFNHQSSNPVKLYLQGILPAPQQFNMIVSNSSVSLSWVAPDSLQVSTPPTISYYVLSNNLTNSTMTFNNPTTCNLFASCNYSLDLRDPFFTLVQSNEGESAPMLGYNGTVEFSLFAVNGAGNGNATTYMMQKKTQTGVENHPSQSVPATENVPYITNTSSNPTHINVVTAVVVVAVGFLLCISVPMLVIFMQRVRKQKTIDTTSPTNNEYVAQSTFVTQVDDPYFVHVPLHLHQIGTNNQRQLNVEEHTHSDASMATF